MMPTTTQIIEATVWTDVRLIGFSWYNGGRDVVMHVEMGSGEDRWVVFTWASGLVIALSHPEGRGGSPLTWDAGFHDNGDGTWTVHFDFAEVGEIRLRCNEVEVLSAPPPQTR